ncbi:SusD/RagB family nutrient-binding outer membrane lipoprotein [Chitinophaga vietnamensis]|uniref:SusD/RagB family nutrient-binding outer membrane lipoprotein n=1 Tax=Chitinophaga vietnamensis TaxID=2593957 RepID=UPI001177437E|nr:SusD/RagB family nutrient-binding outer membrane lipoprotein [Chitinophaga vietnamensis]
MKRKYLAYIGASLVLMATACTKDLENLNKNPNSNTSIPPATMLSNVQLSSATLDRGTVRRTNLSFSMMLVQQLASTETLDGGEGDKYLKNDNCGNLFEATYNNAVINLSQLADAIKGDASQVNLQSAARIWRVLVFQRLTDAYGDVPYFNAGQGYTGGVFFPVYDKQQDIYGDMLKELGEAAAAFDASKKPLGSADLAYGGDIARWKKLAYSLMLRLAFRMEKQDPAKAKEWALKAINGGVMQTNDDICYMRHSGDRNAQMNAIAYTFSSYNLADTKIKISKTFLDYLINTNDPRRAVYASLKTGDTALAHQKGLPNGLDQSGFIAKFPGDSLQGFSTLNTNVILQPTAPTFFITNAEVQLMLAEAVVKGWTSGNAADYYAKAVTSSMQQQKLYGAGGVISDAAIQQYLDANPFPATSADQLKAIGTQYWIATFLNGWESFANWRRTGYPVLTPTNFPGNLTNGTIPRRFTYLLSEYSTNGKNINDAVSRMGKDDYLTRVWWDKQ